MIGEINSHVPSGPLEQKWSKHKFDSKLINPANRRKYEIIVVGSGLAGASAARPLGNLATR
jgi:succinate dehydrogenase / fumarate reductase flavoprotein subunit